MQAYKQLTLLPHTKSGIKTAAKMSFLQLRTVFLTLNAFLKIIDASSSRWSSGVLSLLYSKFLAAVAVVRTNKQTKNRGKGENMKK